MRSLDKAKKRTEKKKREKGREAKNNKVADKEVHSGKKLRSHQ